MSASKKTSDTVVLMNMETLKRKGTQALQWIERYTKTDMIYLARGSFWATSSQVILALASFLLAIAFAHYVPKETYGEYKYILSIVGILTTFTLTGLGTAVIKAVTTGDEGTMAYAFWQNIRWSVLFWVLALGVAVYYFIHGNISLGIALLVAGSLTPFLNSTNLYSPFLIAKKDFRRNALYYNLIGNLFPSLCIFVTMLCTKNPIWFVVVYFVSNTLIGVLLYIRVTRLYKPNKKVDSGALGYGKHLSFIGILSGITDNIDQVLVFHYVGPAQLAIYNFATAIPDQIKGPIGNLGRLMFPKFTERSDKEIRSGMRNKLFLLFLGSALIIGIYWIAAPFIFHLFFPKYTDSIFYSQLFALSLLSVASIPSETYLVAKKKIKEQYIGNISGAFVQIIFLFVGILWWGLLGLVIARIITRFAWSIINISLYNKASQEVMETQ